MALAAQLADALDLHSMDLTPYMSPVSPKQFGRLSGNLLFVSFVIMSWFTIYLVNKPKDQRSLTKELVGAIVASVFAGFGTIFLIMWAGVFL